MRIKCYTMILSLCLIASVTACSQRNAANSGADSKAASSSQTISENTVSESETTEDSASVTEPGKNNRFMNTKGKLLALGDKRLLTSLSVGSAIAGSKEDLDAWYNTIQKASDESVSYLFVNDMGDTERDLTADEIISIMQILKNAKLEIYTELGNTATGGGYRIIALDSEETPLWSIYYDSYWFVVNQNGKARVFDGENSELDNVTDFIYAEKESSNNDDVSDIKSLLDAISSSPTASSVPREYIDAHPEEYDKLLQYGDKILWYSFTEFEKGCKDDLQDSIMLSAVTNILEGENISYAYESVSDWYNTYKKHVLRIYNSNSESYMQEYCPKGYLLLQIIGEVPST